MSKLLQFNQAATEQARNRLLGEWLFDDVQREALYAELRAQGYRVLPFKSLARPRTAGADRLSEDIYLVSSPDDVRTVLRRGSVSPYAGLGSGGKFMLGLDAKATHDSQQRLASEALQYKPEHIARMAREAVDRALVLPLKNHRFDLVQDVARQAALRFVALLFGLPTRVHTALELLIVGGYERLSFQIVGRHFASDDQLPVADSVRVALLQRVLDEALADAAGESDPAKEWWDEPFILGAGTVTARLKGAYRGGSAAFRQDLEELGITRLVATGLMAGTVGNITAAVALALRDFFEPEPAARPRRIWAAREAACADDDLALEVMVRDALRHHPPAPFLTRVATPALGRLGGMDIPDQAYLLLALGASRDPELLFGGRDDASFPHRCIGEHLAWPLIYETVRQVLRLPGLARALDADSGQPLPLRRKWGAVCTEFPLQYQRDRKLNQQPLHVVLPIKPPVAENAARLMRITKAGAPIVERALKESRNVHFAWFSLAENGTHLAMHTVYDGDFDAYVEHFALKVPLFDSQFEFIDVDVPKPITKHPKEFVDVIRRFNRAPMEGYFFSAYPRVGVADVDNAKLEDPS